MPIRANNQSSYSTRRLYHQPSSIDGTTNVVASNLATRFTSFTPGSAMRILPFSHTYFRFKSEGEAISRSRRRLPEERGAVTEGCEAKGGRWSVVG
jgi:hypothetical protein